MAHATAAVAAGAQPAAKRVAVIGAGAAGLAAVLELRAAGHAVTAFEQAPQPGGTWVYSPQPGVHSSMYRDLRTNLPRELMGFPDLPFTPDALGAASRDARRFPGHAEVLAYLQCFADLHQLHAHVQYCTQVVSATPLQDSSASASSSNSSSSLGPRWRLRTARAGQPGASEPAAPGAGQQELDFDALVVANGHYSQPNLPGGIPGAADWPGLQLHSHDYRTPEPFAGQVVVVVGASNSGEDVCREVSAVAKQVVLAARSWKNPAWGSDPTPFGPRRNVARRGMVAALLPGGGVRFAEGAPLPAADAIIWCTGYRFAFPFLEAHPVTAGLSGQQHVPGLWRHMFVPKLGASLSFVGLPWKVVPFPQFQLQAKLIARLLSGLASLPAQAEMEAEAAAFYAGLAASGVPLRHAHMQGDAQWPFNDWLADAAGVPRLPAWRAAMYASTGANKRAHPDDYRDRWDDAESAVLAEAELSALTGRLKAGAAAAAGAAAVAS